MFKKLIIHLSLARKRESCPKSSVRDRRLGHELHVGVGEGAMVCVIAKSCHSNGEVDSGLVVEDDCDASGCGALLELVFAPSNGHPVWSNKRP